MPKRVDLPHRVAGHLALDFANTVGWRDTEREVGYLSSADKILAWALDISLIDSTFEIPATARTELVQDLHALRNAVNEAGTAIAEGRAPPAPAFKVIHALAARSFAAGSLTGVPARIEFAATDAIVGTLAWAAVELLSGGPLHRLKQCPSHDCRWLFIDRTRNGSRRWCDMATCGNREKTRSRR